MLSMRRLSPDPADAMKPAGKEGGSEQKPMTEQQREERAGDNLQAEPDAVDIKQKGEQTGGLEIEETWHRTGGKQPKPEEKKPDKPAEEAGGST